MQYIIVVIWGRIVIDNATPHLFTGNNLIPYLLSYLLYGIIIENEASGYCLRSRIRLCHVHRFHSPYCLFCGYPVERPGFFFYVKIKEFLCTCEPCQHAVWYTRRVGFPKLSDTNFDALRDGYVTLYSS
jgi:hypothetical protein